MGKITYSTHGHFRAELFVITFALVFVSFIGLPKAMGAYGKIKMNSAIDSAYAYKENVDSYFVSKLLLDHDFKLNGTYIISSGDLVGDDSIYNILMGGNVPGGGYLNYDNNILTTGCISVDGYSIIIDDGLISNAQKGSCNML